MCIQHHIIYTCPHTRPLSIEPCLFPSPRTCSTASTTRQIFAPHPCASCRQLLASKWRLEHQVSSLQREVVRKRKADEERMLWDERFRIKMERQREREGEEEKVRLWKEKEERTMREIEGCIMEELERVEMLKSQREDIEIVDLEKGFSLVDLKEVIEEEEKLKETPRGRTMAKRKYKRIGRSTKRLWKAVDGDDGGSEGDDESDEKVDESAFSAKGLGIFFR